MQNLSDLQELCLETEPEFEEHWLIYFSPIHVESVTLIAAQSWPEVEHHLWRITDVMSHRSPRIRLAMRARRPVFIRDQEEEEPEE